MIVLFYRKESEERARVVTRHFKPHKLSPEKRAQGIEVASLPKKERKEGHKAVLYVNPKTGQCWWEYVPKKQDVKD